MIALDFGILGRDLGREQPDVADVVLRTGIRAAGEMNVERRVDLQARIEMIGDCESVALGIARRELAARIAGAGDDSGTNRRCLGTQADCRQGHRHRSAIGFRDVRYDQVLPWREANRATAIALGDVGDCAHLRSGHLSHGEGYAAIHSLRLLLRVKADMRAARERRSWLAFDKG